MNFTILGAGAWGTAMALHLHREGHVVSIVPREMEQAMEMSSKRENKAYFPGHNLPYDIQIGYEISPVLMEAEVVFLACPSVGLRELCRQLAANLTDARELKLLVVLCKGLEPETLMKPADVVAEILPDYPVAVLSGPTFASELARGKPGAAVLACSDSELEAVRQTQEALSGPALRVYLSTDVAGVELGGAIKNVYAIGAGICDGLELGVNAKAAFITRALHELVRIGVAQGGNAATFYGLSGVGDLMMTCYSSLSRNKTFGEQLGRGRSIGHALQSSKGVVEGYTAARCFHSTCRSLGIDTPILDEIYAILYEQRNPAHAVRMLMSRELRDESFS